MKLWIHLGVGITLLSIGTGCMNMFGPPPAPQTPMAQTDVDKLTTCSHGDMEKIRKNLLLAGYSVRSSTHETIETEFKQIDSTNPYSRGKSLVRVSVVKVDGKTAKFHVRTRSESLDKIETGQAKDYRGNVIATDSQLVRNTDEGDMKFYNEQRTSHEGTHHEVCGS